MELQCIERTLILMGVRSNNLIPFHEAAYRKVNSSYMNIDAI